MALGEAFRVHGTSPHTIRNGMRGIDVPGRAKERKRNLAGPKTGPNASVTEGGGLLRKWWRIVIQIVPPIPEGAPRATYQGHLGVWRSWPTTTMQHNFKSMHIANSGSTFSGPYFYLITYFGAAAMAAQHAAHHTHVGMACRESESAANLPLPAPRHLHGPS
jgi:hypothetical protein